MPNQIREITVATSDRHPRLDEVSAKAAGAAYARRWDAERTAWMRDLSLTDDAEQREVAPSGKAGRLNLSAMRGQAGEQVSPDEEILRRFRTHLIWLSG
ncbi:hypothetical protein ACFYZB_42710 [Streptomyces sp. NPDC001852]|uniref:hypothetical protein n=1 Tax=Streptomyces sp. NPDC001852 TaxID=3364619 RepID=UPI003685E484